MCFPYSDSSGNRFQLCFNSTNVDISLVFPFVAVDLVCMRNSRVYQTQYDSLRVQTRYTYLYAYTRYELHHNLGSVLFECLSDVNWRK